MKLRSVLLAGALAAGIGAVSAQAHAAILVATYTGKVSSGVDPGVFASPGTDLTGFDYVAVFTIDTTLPQYFSSSAGDELQGPGAPSTPPVSGQITINGHTVSMVGDNTSDAFTFPGSSFLGHEAFDEDVSAGIETEADLDMEALNVVLPSVLDTLPLTNVSTLGDFSFFQEDLTSGDILVNALFDLDDPDATATLQITTAGGVPEPATWAMMLVGFAGLGATLRSRRRRRGPAAAI